MSINNNIKFLEHLKQRFRRIVRSETRTEPQSNNLDCMIDQMFRNINMLFSHSFKNGGDDPTINYFDKYYMPLFEIKYFNALINNKPFFDQPIKNKQETYEKLVEMSQNNHYITGNVSDYQHHQNYHKLVSIDLSGQANMTIPQQTNFTEKSEKI